MIVDLNDPSSLVRWHAVFPERHAAFLIWARKQHQQFQPSIDEAIKTIRRASSDQPAADQGYRSSTP